MKRNLAARWIGVAIVASFAVPIAANADEPLEHQAEVKSVKPSEEAMEKGKALFQQNCSACHQSNGQGLPGAFPPLANSDFLRANPAAILDVTTRGKQGKLVVNGQTYDNVMPAMSYLSDKDLGLIITYVLNSWGNPGGRITADEVAKARAAKDAAAPAPAH